MASRFATRPGRPSVNSSARHSARNTNASGFASRSRRSTDRDEEESSESAFPMWKTIGVVAVVFGCFATVYPKMFHPMLLYVLGYGQQQSSAEEMYPHPAMKHGAGFGASRQPQFAAPANDRQHAPFPGGRGPVPGVGPGVHPTGETRGSKSVWHWMLPFYTIGVIIFLLYTLSKILWKKPKKKASRRPVNSHYDGETDPQELDDTELDDVDEDEVEEEDDERPSSAGMSSGQLRGLQRRLQDTEHAMHEILTQLEQLSTTADPRAAEQIKTMTMETLNGLGQLGASRVAGGSKRIKNADLPNVSGRRGKGLQFDSTERRYLAELQKALSDFKQFTENYIDEHSQKQQGEANTTATTEDALQEKTTDLESENKKSDDTVKNNEMSATAVMDEFDVMESEKPCTSEELKMEKGDGQLFPWDEFSEKHNLNGVMEKEDASAGQRREEDTLDEGQRETGESASDKSADNEEWKNSTRQVRRRKGRKLVRQEE